MSDPSAQDAEESAALSPGSSHSVEHDPIGPRIVGHPRSDQMLDGGASDAPQASPSNAATLETSLDIDGGHPSGSVVSDEAVAARRHPGQNGMMVTRAVYPPVAAQNTAQMKPPTNSTRSTAGNRGNAGQRILTTSTNPTSSTVGGKTSIKGERRGLFYDDLGSLDRYPPNLTPLKVAYPDPEALMEGVDYAMQVQLQIEHQEQCIIMFDKEGTMFHLGAALGHRDVHRVLAATLYARLDQDLAARLLPAVETVRFLRIPSRPTLQEISSNFEDCRINDCIWSLRKGTHWNDLTRNSLLVVVFASPSDARNADLQFRRNRWFAEQTATLDPMRSSKKQPTGAPNWEFFDLCRRLRLELLKSIFTNCLLSDVSHRMPPAIQKDLEEKGARGQLSLGNSLYKPNKNVTSNTVVVRPPPSSRLPMPDTRAVNPPPPASLLPLPMIPAVQASDTVPHTAPVYRQPRLYVPLRPPSRPQADERQALIIHRIVGSALKSFFKAFTKAHPCCIWNGDAMLRLLKEAMLRHPPIGDLIREKVDAAGDCGNELRRLRDSTDTTILYGTALERELPVFARPNEYQGGMGIRSKMLKVLTLANIELVRDAMQSASYVAVSLRDNPGFEPAIRLLSLASQERAFVIDLAGCPFDDARVQALFSSLLTSKALLCFETQPEVLRFQSLCTAQTAADFEARLYEGGFTGPSKVLQKCPVSPVWQPANEALLHRYHGLEHYVAKYLGACLNTAYDEYLYCASLNEYVYEETGLRAIAMAMLLRRCQIEVADSWSQMVS